MDIVVARAHRDDAGEEVAFLSGSICAPESAMNGGPNVPYNVQRELLNGVKLTLERDPDIQQARDELERARTAYMQTATRLATKVVDGWLTEKGSVMKQLKRDYDIDLKLGKGVTSNDVDAMFRTNVLDGISSHPMY